jgi:hypothetical protein
MNQTHRALLVYKKAGTTCPGSNEYQFIKININLHQSIHPNLLYDL